MPRWCEGLIHIKHPDVHDLKTQNVISKIYAAVDYANISEDFIFMNDDFFIKKGSEI
jgi:hypothetical protein